MIASHRLHGFSFVPMVAHRRAAVAGKVRNDGCAEGGGDALEQRRHFVVVREAVADEEDQ